MKLATKDSNLADVMEVLDAANNVNEDDGIDAESNVDHDGDTVSDTDATTADEDSDADGSVEKRKQKFREEGKHDSTRSKDLQEDGKRGVVSQIKDFKQHHKQLGRRNRGLMQWKAARTIKADGTQKGEGGAEGHEAAWTPYFGCKTGDRGLIRKLTGYIESNLASKAFWGY